MIVEFLVALIGLGVAIDYSLLVVVRWREERAHGHEGEEAVVRAMQTAGRAVAFSGTTVAIGLLAMIVLPLPFLRSIGYAGMLIPLVSVVVATTLLPIVLLKAGNRLDWPHVRSDDQASRSWTRWAHAGRPPPLVRGRRRRGRARRARARRHRAQARPGRRQHAVARPARPTPACWRSSVRASAPARWRRSRCWRRRPRGRRPRPRWRRSTGSARRSRPAARSGGVTAPRCSTCSPSPTAPRRAGVDDDQARADRGQDAGRRRPRRWRRSREHRLRRRDLRQLPADDRADRGAHVPAAGAGVPVAAAAAQGGAAQRDQRRRRLGRDHAGVAAGPRL